MWRNRFYLLIQHYFYLHTAMVGFLSAVWILLPGNKSNYQFLVVQHLPNIQQLSYFSHLPPDFCF